MNQCNKKTHYIRPNHEVYFIDISYLAYAELSAQINYKYQNNLSFSYSETIENYKILDSLYANARLVEMGKSDIGRPIHLFISFRRCRFFT